MSKLFLVIMTFSFIIFAIMVIGTLFTSCTMDGNVTTTTPGIFECVNTVDSTAPSYRFDSDAKTTEGRLGIGSDSYFTFYDLNNGKTIDSRTLVNYECEYVVQFR